MLEFGLKQVPQGPKQISRPILDSALKPLRLAKYCGNRPHRRVSLRSRLLAILYEDSANAPQQKCGCDRQLAGQNYDLTKFMPTADNSKP
ncbi:hypothetical protein QT982_26050 [Microcoleus sp. herbarium2]